MQVKGVWRVLIDDVGELTVDWSVTFIAFLDISRPGH
jgi:hypothetical protein